MGRPKDTRPKISFRIGHGDFAFLESIAQATASEPGEVARMILRLAIWRPDGLQSMKVLDEALWKGREAEALAAAEAASAEAAATEQGEEDGDDAEDAEGV